MTERAVEETDRLECSRLQDLLHFPEETKHIEKTSQDMGITP